MQGKEGAYPCCSCNAPNAEPGMKTRHQGFAVCPLHDCGLQVHGRLGNAQSGPEEKQADNQYGAASSFREKEKRQASDRTGRENDSSTSIAGREDRSNGHGEETSQSETKQGESKLAI